MSSTLTVRKLKLRLIELAEDPANHNELKNIFALLRKDVDGAYHEIYDKYEERGFNSRNMVDQEFLKLVDCLRNAQKLPTLMFCFDKYLIERLMIKLLEYLEPLSKDEKHPLLWPNVDQKNRALRTYIRPVVENLGCQICKQLDPRPEICDHPVEFSDADASPEHLRALSLGIAVHYNDMSAPYKIEVERLYRETDSEGIVIPVIIATSTLALGVHMPARSVVMLGTSIYLDNSTFFQCSGRSGRRGFDDVGHVVMLAFPHPQINRFLTADITQVSGPVGISASFVLRVMMLHHFGSINDNTSIDYLTNCCLRVLQQPLFRHGGQVTSSQEQMRHQVRFSIELMRRFHHLNDKGQPLKYSGFISNLHYSEPSNYLIVEILKKGMLDPILEKEWPSIKKAIEEQDRIEVEKDKLVAEKKKALDRHDRDIVRKLQNDIQVNIDKCDALEEQAKFNDDTLKGLVEVLCHIFGRRRVFKKGKAVHTLKPPSKELIDLMANFNATVRDIFAEYVNSYSGAHLAQIQEESLPLTKKAKNITRDHTVTNATPQPVVQQQVQEVKQVEEDEDLEDWELDTVEEKPASTQQVAQTQAPVSRDTSDITGILHKNRIQYSSVSSFAALSGNEDHFKDIDQLVGTLNDNIILDRSIIPYVDINDESLLNSYVLDFFEHGNIQLLIDQNGFNTNNAALNAIRGFVGQIRKVHASLVKLEKGSHRNVAEALGQIIAKLNLGMFGPRESTWRKKREYIKRVKEEHARQVGKMLEDESEAQEDFDDLQSKRSMRGDFDN